MSPGLFSHEYGRALTPKCPRGPKVSSVWQSNSKCCNFCIQHPNSIKLVNKFGLALLVFVVKFSDQSKMYSCFGSQSKFTGSIRVHQTAFDGCNLGGLYLLHQIFFFNNIFWIFFPFKPTYCGKIFMSIWVVLNFWEQFEVQNPHIFALQWTLMAYNFFIKGPFSIIFLGKVGHTSLVFLVKISYQYKKL